jgi:hypothetical protein
MSGRLMLLVALFLPSLIAPGGALAQATPTGTPTSACVFPPVSVDLLREIEADASARPIPTPTRPAQGAWHSELHQYGFPPPAGEALDDETVASVQAFLADYQACLQSGDIVGVYGAWTEPYLRLSLAQHPETIEPIVEVIESDLNPFAHPGLDLLLLRAWHIETGHIVALVQIVDTPQVWLLYLAPAGESWRIDDIWDVENCPMCDGLPADNLTGPVYGTPVAVD